MIYRLKYAKSESNFDADFEHPTLQGALLTVTIPRAMPWEGTEKVPSWVMLV